MGPKLVMQGYGGYGSNLPLRRGGPSQVTYRRRLAPFFPLGYGSSPPCCGYSGIPMTPEEWAEVEETFPEIPPAGMSVAEAEEALCNVMTTMTNVMADTDFPLDGRYPPERAEALDDALITALGHDYHLAILGASPEEVGEMLGMPTPQAALFQEGFARARSTLYGPSPKEEKPIWPWVVGIIAASVVSSVITGACYYSATKG